MSPEFKSLTEAALEAENAGLRDLLAQAGIDASRLLAQAGIEATEKEAATRLQRLLLEELHHRVKNTLATVIAITAQSLRTAENLKSAQVAARSSQAESLQHRRDRTNCWRDNLAGLCRRR